MGNLAEGGTQLRTFRRERPSRVLERMAEKFRTMTPVYRQPLLATAQSVGALFQTFLAYGSDVRRMAADEKSIGGSLSSRFMMTAFTNACLAILGVLTGTLVARLLGPQGRGELAAIQIWANVIYGITSLGLAEALLFVCSRQRRDSGRFLTSSAALVFAFSLPVLALGYVLMPYLLSADAKSVVNSARLYLLYVPLAGWALLLSQVLRASNEFRMWNVARALPSAGWLILLIVAAVTSNMRAHTLARWYLFVMVLLVICSVGLVARRMTGPFSFSGKGLRQLVSFGLPATVATFPQLLNLRLDQLALAGFFPPRELGLYSVATAWSLAVYPLLHALGAVIFPAVASEPVLERRNYLVVGAARVGATCAVLTGTIVGLMTPLGVPLLFGRSFQAAVPASVVLIFASSILWFNFVLAEGLKGLGRPKTVMIAEFIGLAVTLTGLVGLLPAFGIVGAGFSCVLGYGSVAIVLLHQTAKATEQPMRVLLKPNARELIGLGISLRNRIKSR